MNQAITLVDAPPMIAGSITEQQLIIAGGGGDLNT